MKTKECNHCGRRRLIKFFSLKKDGDRGIVSYLSNLKIEDISANFILIIDALRSSLKYADNLKDPVLLYIINNQIETEHVE